MDYSLPGSSVRGIHQARILQWDAISFSDVLDICGQRWKKGSHEKWLLRLALSNLWICNCLRWGWLKLGWEKSWQCNQGLASLTCYYHSSRRHFNLFFFSPLSGWWRGNPRSSLELSEMEREVRRREGADEGDWEREGQQGRWKTGVGSRWSQGGKQVNQEENDQGKIVLTRDPASYDTGSWKILRHLCTGGCTCARMGFCVTATFVCSVQPTLAPHKMSLSVTKLMMAHLLFLLWYFSLLL